MKIAEAIAGKAAKVDRISIDWDPGVHDIIVLGKKPDAPMGVILDDTALLFEQPAFRSYRIRRGNLGFTADVAIYSVKGGLDKDNLSDYFDKNRDNPFGVYQLLFHLQQGSQPDELTQLPPLFRTTPSLDYYQSRLQALIDQAVPADLIFSRSEDSSISSLIRKEDRFPFSHVGTYIGDGRTCDATLDGVQIIDLMAEEDVNTHYAFYRFRDEIPAETRDEIVSFLKETASSQTSFNYSGIIDLWIRKRLGKPSHPDRPSVTVERFSSRASYDLQQAHEEHVTL